MKSTLSLLALLALPTLPASASTTYTGNWTVNTVIPDNNDIGYSDTHTLSVAGIDNIETVTVNMDFSGGWNGDLYAYLVHDSSVAVLLNRAGLSVINPDGAGSSGLNINFSDTAASDIHTAIPLSGGVVTGTYQPDGRTTDPLAVLDTDPRTAMLSSFTGQNANGSWTLFVADQSPGSTSTLTSWSLSVTGVPEPSSAVLGALGIIPLFFRRRAGR